MLTGRRGVAILYAYMLLGLGFLRVVTPDFGDLGNREQELEGSFRYFFVCARVCIYIYIFFSLCVKQWSFQNIFKTMYF